MPDAYWPYLAVVAGGLALWGVAALHGWLRRRDAAWQPARPGDTPGADAVRDDSRIANRESAVYRPCAHTWDANQPEGHGTWAPWHRCTRHPDNGHTRHVCLCGAGLDVEPVDDVELPPLSEDPVAIRLGIVPDPTVVPAPLISAGQPASPQPDRNIPAKYLSRTAVIYGLGTVHSGCLVARRDAATDHICGDCAKLFGRVAAL